MEITLEEWAAEWFCVHAYVGPASGLRQGELISLPWAAVDVCGRRTTCEAHRYVLENHIVPCF